MPGVLFVVATPIGNLSDLTLRAIRVLGEVAVIACEDTRVTRKLLEAHGISTPLTSFHAHSGAGPLSALLARLEAGEQVALVSDAGTPLVSDPGADLVSAAIARGIEVVPVPGASALLAALAASGLPPQPFLFLGFLPRADVERRELLAPLREAPYTLVIYEAANRVPETLAALQRSLGDREACLARELTKKFETFARGPLSALVERFQEAPLGEVVLVVGPGVAGRPSPGLDAARDEAARLLASGQRPSEVARAIAGAFGLAKQEAYQLVLALKGTSEV
jgi:16S rRNA (cytidine1402-2'-O)-methyltransferase